ncbi:hypothetical protein ACSBR1_003654 [Camellia fascicularis]
MLCVTVPLPGPPWTLMGIPESLTPSFSSDTPHWLHVNCESNVRHQSCLWAVLFPLTCWTIWKHRNAFCFDNNPPPIPNPATITANAVHWQFVSNFPHPSKTKILSFVNWKPPDHPRFKLNIDGAARDNPGAASARGIIRDSTGTWVSGFSRNIGYTTSVAAKLWGLRDRLQLARDLNLPNIEVETNATIV